MSRGNMVKLAAILGHKPSDRALNLHPHPLSTSSSKHSTRIFLPCQPHLLSNSPSGPWGASPSFLFQGTRLGRQVLPRWEVPGRRGRAPGSGVFGRWVHILCINCLIILGMGLPLIRNHPGDVFKYTTCQPCYHT